MGFLLKHNQKPWKSFGNPKHPMSGRRMPTIIQAGYRRDGRKRSPPMSHVLKRTPMSYLWYIHSLHGTPTKHRLIAYSALQHIRRANERHLAPMQQCYFQISNLSSYHIRPNGQKYIFGFGWLVLHIPGFFHSLANDI